MNLFSSPIDKKSEVFSFCQIGFRYFRHLSGVMHVWVPGYSNRFLHHFNMNIILTSIDLNWALYINQKFDLNFSSISLLTKTATCSLGIMVFSYLLIVVLLNFPTAIDMIWIRIFCYGFFVPRNVMSIPWIWFPTSITYSLALQLNCPLGYYYL